MVLGFIKQIVRLVSTNPLTVHRIAQRPLCRLEVSLPNHKARMFNVEFTPALTILQNACVFGHFLEESLVNRSFDRFIIRISCALQSVHFFV